MSENKNKFNICLDGRRYDYDKKGGWDIDTSEKATKQVIADIFLDDFNRKEQLMFQNMMLTIIIN